MASVCDRPVCCNSKGQRLTAVNLVILSCIKPSLFLGYDADRVINGVPGHTVSSRWPAGNSIA